MGTPELATSVHADERARPLPVFATGSAGFVLLTTLLDHVLTRFNGRRSVWQSSWADLYMHGIDP